MVQDSTLVRHDWIYLYKFVLHCQCTVIKLKKHVEGFLFSFYGLLNLEGKIKLCLSSLVGSQDITKLEGRTWVNYSSAAYVVVQCNAPLPLYQSEKNAPCSVLYVNSAFTLLHVGCTNNTKILAQILLSLYGREKRFLLINPCFSLRFIY